MSKEEITQKIIEDIKQYVSDGSNVKAYEQSMQEMDKWLKAIKK